MAKPRVMYQRILEVLQTEGPLSLPKLHAKLSEYSYKALQDTIAQLLGKPEGEEKKIYVMDYEAAEGKGGLSSRVLAIGNLPDKKRPPGNHLAAAKKYRDKPEVKERRLATDRNRRRNRKIEKHASKNVFNFMAKPVTPVELKAVSVRTHECEDDEELRPTRRRAA